MSDIDTLIWAEQYRPSNIDECILPTQTKKALREAIDSGNIQHLLMFGPPGTGKTSACRAIANELQSDLMYINASLERSIDIIRNQVVSFSSSVSFSGGLKIVLLDEFDGMLSTQQNALKGVIEEFPNARFFFTSNHINKVIDPIKSRCVNINFKIDNKEKPLLASRFFKRVSHILKEKNVEFEPAVVAELVTKYFPDFRRTLNELQRYAVGGKIDSGILANQNAESFKDLFDAMRKSDFMAVRKWTASNSDIDPHVLFRDIYDNGNDLFDVKCLPQIILILADYSFKATHSVDPEILVTAAMTEIMVTGKFK